MFVLIFVLMIVFSLSIAVAVIADDTAKILSAISATLIVILPIWALVRPRPRRYVTFKT